MVSEKDLKVALSLVDQARSDLKWIEKVSNGNLQSAIIGLGSVENTLLKIQKEGYNAE